MSGIKKIQITSQEKELLEKLSGTQIHLRNTFGDNQEAINSLLDQGKQNAFIYLERNKLGQRLSIFEENNLFAAVVDLQKKLGLKNLPRHMECYDISHISGKFVYGSMVTFYDGRPAKKMYKLFKTKEQNNDFENHKEVLRRRFQRALDWELEKRVKQEYLAEQQEYLEANLNPKNDENPWKLADLIIVDGGKGQLSSDLVILEEYRQIFRDNNLPFEVEICALAKREEEIFLPYNPEPVIVEGKTRFLVQRIRDEAHRFAITNNRNARLRTAKKSQLEEISGIGQVTKEKLLKTFGSVENIIDNLYKNQEIVYELVGQSIVEKLKKHFGII
jgi:excinuclease ABC subunit C